MIVGKDVNVEEVMDCVDVDCTLSAMVHQHHLNSFLGHHLLIGIHNPHYFQLYTIYQTLLPCFDHLWTTTKASD